MKWILLLFAALVAAIAADAAEPMANEHDPFSEMAQVRAHMRAGQYRYALVFAAHVAGEHRTLPEASALYASLLYVGGQGAAARRLFEDARLPFPQGAIVVPAPLAASASLPDGARISGSGVLIDAGRRALLPLAAIEDASRVWVRNGLGDLASARVERREASAGVAVARLDRELPFDTELETSARVPFPGSVGFSVGHPAASPAEPTWPLLATGFVGRAVGNTSMRQLSADLSAGGRGGAVFDAGGRLLGIAVPHASGSVRLVPTVQIPEAVGSAGVASASGARTMPVERIYEGALCTALQVIVTR